MTDYTLYEQLKAAWIEAHPESTPEQYQAAMRKIAEDLGL